MKLFDELQQIAKASEEQAVARLQAFHNKVMKQAPKEADSIFQQLAEVLRKRVRNEPGLVETDLYLRTEAIPKEIQMSYHEKVLDQVYTRLENEGISVVVLHTQYEDEHTEEEYGEDAAPNFCVTAIRVKVKP